MERDIRHSIVQIAHTINSGIIFCHPQLNSNTYCIMRRDKNRGLGYMYLSIFYIETSIT